MRYSHIISGEFLERENRFIAYVEVEGVKRRVHVKNTGRCRELLTDRARVYLEQTEAVGRSTDFDLVAVEKGSRLINMDSQAPNQAVAEWLSQGALFPDIQRIKPEYAYGSSRFDFYVETKEERILLEVKGVTLEEDGVVRFPDAPSERAVKHTEELIRAKKEGYRACILFVIQMKDVRYLTPNEETHPAFAKALWKAWKAGVEIYAYDCAVEADSMALRDPVPVFFSEAEAAEELANRERREHLSRIPQPLLAWYDRQHRQLPWRENPSPYRVWVSEIMLQQTRVEAVRPYFERFLTALPDIPALAGAPEETLLKLWEGLGYYNRARNLQRAAVRIMEEYGGQMPGEYEALLKLPGIGSYTAGAIASIAFGQKAAAVDGNVLRVAMRVLADDDCISLPGVKRALEDAILAVMPQDRPGDFNQAMMELGACVCVPNGAPHCEECPLTGICRAGRDGNPQDYPVKAAARERTVEEKTILLLRDADTVVLRKRGPGLLAGMYEFPWMEGFRTAKEVKAYLTDRGISTLRIRQLPDAKHIFSHREWHMKGYLIRVDELERGEVPEEWIYIEPQETRERYPIPAAFAAYTKYLDIRLGKESF